MSSELLDFDITPYIVRLKAAPDFREVAGAAAFDQALEKMSVDTGAYFVYLGGPASPINATGVHEQLRRPEFEIYTSVRNVADPLGEDAERELQTYRLAVLERITGWTPNPHVSPAELVEDRLWKFADGYIWWRFKYRCEFVMTIAQAA